MKRTAFRLLFIVPLALTVIIWFVLDALEIYCGVLEDFGDWMVKTDERL